MKENNFNVLESIIALIIIVLIMIGIYSLANWSIIYFFTQDVNELTIENVNDKVHELALEMLKYKCEDKGGIFYEYENQYSYFRTKCVKNNIEYRNFYGFDWYTETKSIKLK